MFPRKSTSFSPQLSNLLSFSHVEHYIIEKAYLYALKLSKENWDVMHYARINLPGENGYRQYGQNRARTKPVFSILYFTFKQGQNTNSDQINQFQCILYTLTMNLNSMSDKY